MDFNHKAILKSDNIEKINGSVEKKFRFKIEICDNIINHYNIIDELQKDILNLYLNISNNLNKKEIIKNIKLKKKLRNFHIEQIHLLKKNYL